MDGKFPVFDGRVEKGHLLFKVFPSHPFIKSDRPFERPQKVEISKTLSLFFSSFHSISIYFNGTVKLYVDGTDVNFHVATPAQDFLLSYARSPIESIRNLRKALRIPDNTIGTYLEYKEDLKDLERLEGVDGLFIRSGDPVWGRMKTAGFGKDFDLNVRGRWRVVKSVEEKTILTSSLDLKLLASENHLSPVFITSSLEVPLTRRIISNEMKKVYEEGYPPLSPTFFHHPEDRNTWYQRDLVFVAKNLILPLLSWGEKFKSVYIPKGKWLKLSNKEMVEGMRCHIISKDEILMGENSTVHYEDGGEKWIIAFITADRLKDVIYGRTWIFERDKITIGEGEEEIGVVNVVVRGKDRIKEVSLRVDGGEGKEVKI